MSTWWRASILPNGTADESKKDIGSQAGANEDRGSETGTTETNNEQHGMEAAETAIRKPAPRIPEESEADTGESGDLRCGFANSTHQEGSSKTQSGEQETHITKNGNAGKKENGVKTEHSTTKQPTTSATSTPHSREQTSRNEQTSQKKQIGQNKQTGYKQTSLNKQTGQNKQIGQNKQTSQNKQSDQNNQTTGKNIQSEKSVPSGDRNRTTVTDKQTQENRTKPPTPPETGSSDTSGTGAEAANQGFFGWWSFAPAPSTWWPFSRQEPDDDLVRAAMLAVESARDRCSYAVRAEPRAAHMGDTATTSARTETGLSTASKGTGENSASASANGTVANNTTINNTTINNTHNATSTDVSNWGGANGNTKAKTNTADASGTASAFSLELAVAGTASERSPVPIEVRPRTQAEAAEIALGRGAGSGSVVPSLECMRRITLRTRARLQAEATFWGSQTSERHLYRRSNTIAVRHAVVVSIHSFMPSKLAKVLVGQHTGSASQMAKHAQAAIFRCTDKCTVSTIALEGSGPLGARTEESLALLTNWAAELRGCDLIYFVCNSVAAPLAAAVACGVAARLGVAPPKMAFLALAGAWQGPAVSRDSAVVSRAYTPSERAAIDDLFSLQNPRSRASEQLAHNIGTLCAHNVKITLAAAAGDQFVPLASAHADNVCHPNIFRCVYAGEGDAPPFLVTLTGVLATMQNVGRGTSALARDLGASLLGPKGAAGAHGRILRCNELYDLGVRFALESTSLVHKREAYVAEQSTSTLATPNLFHVPWNLRGLVHEMLETKHIGNLKLLNELVKELREWDPTTAKWREIKSCFAALEDLSMDELLL
ncbi:hypothetical protein EJF18_20619 [Clavispora lusitaniae]|uniref:Uncharacterized protein n=1 Tax=Clavispora lusitaniae TaxID=36911 RepID=A0ACD0WGK9_CLALS|nr:hypothetical protein EJF14_20619 [Clavispora lusitaniae]QFZ32372.1 hypothetical protein EJF16_20619 [Clavispora lusitaniae]QFZ38041.1 hypothetical protein EJF15_20619 [Clavispora lusitaniae]QFZ43724.1 hypothetical protein EJF18_20619 [Clavispora lusitaniae]QFZ49401.1 hypothetical protein EJF17_20619 [Clavispora lusitaniae]